MIQNYLIIGMAILFAIAIVQLHRMANEQEELIQKLQNKNRLIWDYETELLNIKSKIQEANDRAKTWELQATYLKDKHNDKSISS